MGKMLFIEACASCRYYDYNGDLDRVYCDYGQHRKIPQTVDPSAATPEWCPLPDWDGTIKDLTGE